MSSAVVLARMHPSEGSWPPALRLLFCESLDFAQGLSQASRLEQSCTLLPSGTVLFPMDRAWRNPSLALGITSHFSSPRTSLQEAIVESTKKQKETECESFNNTKHFEAEFRDSACVNQIWSPQQLHKCVDF